MRQTRILVAIVGIFVTVSQASHEAAVAQISSTDIQIQTKMNLVHHFVRMGQHAEAAKVALEVTQMPEASGFWRAQAFLLRGLSLARLKQFSEAKAALHLAATIPGGSEHTRERANELLKQLANVE